MELLPLGQVGKRKMCLTDGSYVWLFGVGIILKPPIRNVLHGLKYRNDWPWVLSLRFNLGRLASSEC